MRLSSNFKKSFIFSTLYIMNLKNLSSEPEFSQAVTEVLESLTPFLEKNAKYRYQSLLERIIEPERTIMFRISRVDDAGQVQVNRGYRVQFNSAI